jgi:predicted alpha/beta superfamily hydrolase
MNDRSFRVTLVILVVLTLLVMAWAPTATGGLALSDTPTPTPHHDYLPLLLKYYASASTPTPTATKTPTSTHTPTPTHTATATTVPPTPVAGVMIPGTELRTLYSSVTSKDYTIYVALPAGYSSSGDTYPVVYLLDGDMWFGLTTGMVPILAFEGSLPELIIVGIGYGTHDIDEWFELRERDLSSGAGEFLRFIQEELMPYIDSNYRTDPTDRTIVGHSLGGLFTVYALFHAPETFDRYIAASPALWWDDRVAFDYEENFARDHSELPVRLFLSVGELEEEQFPGARMVSNLEEFHANLESRNYDGLEIEMVIMEDETHGSVISGAFSRGFRVVFQ